MRSFKSRYAPKIAQGAILLTLVGVAVSGCGSGAAIRGIGHGSSHQQVAADLLKTMDTWETTSARVIDVVHLSGTVRTLDLVLDTASSPNRYALTIDQSRHAQLTIVDGGHNTISYTAGSGHYEVTSDLPFSAEAMRLIGVGLPQIISASKIDDVHMVNANEVELVMSTPLPSGIRARADFWYDLKTNAPLAFAAHWKGGSFSQTVTQFTANPNLRGSVFTFDPPAGVKPEVVLTTTETDLQLAEHAENFPIELPPSSADLTLDNVSVGKSQGQTVVLLTYTAPNGAYVLVTEFSASDKRKFPPDVSVSTVPYGEGSISSGVLPQAGAGEIDGFEIQRTEVWVEGQDTPVNNLMSVWANSVTTSAG